MRFFDSPEYLVAGNTILIKNSLLKFFMNNKFRNHILLQTKLYSQIFIQLHLHETIWCSLHILWIREKPWNRGKKFINLSMAQYNIIQHYSSTFQTHFDWNKKHEWRTTFNNEYEIGIWWSETKTFASEINCCRSSMKCRRFLAASVLLQCSSIFTQLLKLQLMIPGDLKYVESEKILRKCTGSSNPGIVGLKSSKYFTQIIEKMETFLKTTKKWPICYFLSDFFLSYTLQKENWSKWRHSLV